MNDVNNVKRFTGRIFWISPNIRTIPSRSKLDFLIYADIKRAIINDTNFIIEWVSRDTKPGEMKLNTTDYINYKGFSIYTDEKEISSTITCTLYENSNGAFLIGTELESGSNSTFLAELVKVEKFENNILKRK